MRTKGTAVVALCGSLALGLTGCALPSAQPPVKQISKSQACDQWSDLNHDVSDSFDSLNVVSSDGLKTVAAAFEHVSKTSAHISLAVKTDDAFFAGLLRSYSAITATAAKTARKMASGDTGATSKLSDELASATSKVTDINTACDS